MYICQQSSGYTSINSNCSTTHAIKRQNREYILKYINLMDQQKTERGLRLMKMMTGNNYTVEDMVESMIIARIC